MRSIIHNTLRTIALSAILTFAPLAPAQDLPEDLTCVSPAAALTLNTGRLYRFSSWPNNPPLPPDILLIDPALAEEGSGSATNVFYSASLAAVFWDDRESLAEQLLLAAATNGNHQIFQDEQQGDNELPPLDTTGLYLELTNVADGLAYFNLRNATNQVYAIRSTCDLAAGWSVVAEVWPTNTDVMPFTLPTLDQPNLFALAQDWTGVTENENTTPDWWLWQYYGTVALSDTNLDSQRTNTLLYDYTNNIDPNIITFTVATTNQYVNQATTLMQVNLLAGEPSYYAVLLNDTNTAAATWLSYPGTNLSVQLGATDATYTVSIGLRGRPLTATQSWQSLKVFRDTTPLTLGLTNLPSFSGSRPFLDPAGYASRTLSALNWTLVDATGATNTGNGMVVGKDWSLSDPWHATNWLLCPDLPLALGTNWISIQATDWAGSVAATNFAYVFDTAPDTNAPVLNVVWPSAGALVSAESFTVQATTDDDTAAVVLQYYDGDGILQTVNGLVERGGKVWVPDVPLAAGTNHLTVLTTDAAGNVATNNLTVLGTNTVFTIDPLSDEEMQKGYVTVTGHLEDPDGLAEVTVNGVTATNTYGWWTAYYVPIQRGGIVTLAATAQLGNGTNLHTMLTQERGAFVFTERFGYKLDYSMLDWTTTETNGSEAHSIDFEWASGLGGTNTEINSSVDFDTLATSSNVTVTVWPADPGYVPCLKGQQVIRQYDDGHLTSTYTRTVDAPELQWMEKSSSGGTWPQHFAVSWTESSDRVVHLFTGGSPARQRQGLFDASAVLNIASRLDWNVPDWRLHDTGHFLNTAGAAR